MKDIYTELREKHIGLLRSEAEEKKEIGRLKIEIQQKEESLQVGNAHCVHN